MGLIEPFPGYHYREKRGHCLAILRGEAETGRPGSETPRWVICSDPASSRRVTKLRRPTLSAGPDPQARCISARALVHGLAKCRLVHRAISS